MTFVMTANRMKLAALAIIASVCAVSPVYGAATKSVNLNPQMGVAIQGQYQPPQVVQRQPTAAQQKAAQKQLAAQQAADAAASAKAAAVAAAETKVGAASKTLNDLVAKLMADFNASPEFVAAQQAVQAATKAHHDATLPVLAALPASNPTYKEAAAKLAALTAKSASNLRAQEISSNSQEIFDLGNVMGPIEQAAIADDSGCMAAKAKLDEAMGVVTKMLADFKASLDANSDYTSAKAALDSAKADLATARAK